MTTELDLAPTFQKESEHLGSLLAKRDEYNTRRISFDNVFLDDCLGGLYPDDLILAGAGTGVGKTALACSLAHSAAKGGVDPVYMFALEAEVGEIAARLGYTELAKGHRGGRIDFSGWWRGRYPELDKQWPTVAQQLEPSLSRLRTLYKRRGDFTNTNLSQQLETIAGDAKLVIVDHIHVVDTKAGSELAAQHKTVRLLRDFALDCSIPVFAVSHIRKRDQSARGVVVPEVDDLHGSSALQKIATGVVLFAPDWDGERPKPWLAPTLIRVAKDRRGRASRLWARLYYNMRTCTYGDTYRLGYIGWEKRQQIWLPLPASRVPDWARRESTRTSSSTPF